MKRFGIITVAAILMCAALCSCSGNTATKVKDKASEAAAELKDDMQGTAYPEETQVVRETIVPTETRNLSTESIGDMIETEWDDMVENGKVDDGDGNVGKAENRDGDGNADHEN